MLKDADTGRSHQGLAMLWVHGCGGAKPAAVGHGRARGEWLGLSVLIQKKKEAEKSH